MGGALSLKSSGSISYAGIAAMISGSLGVFEVMINLTMPSQSRLERCHFFLSHLFAGVGIVCLAADLQICAVTALAGLCMAFMMYVVVRSQDGV